MALFVRFERNVVPDDPFWVRIAVNAALLRGHALRALDDRRAARHVVRPCVEAENVVLIVQALLVEASPAHVALLQPERVPAHAAVGAVMRMAGEPLLAVARVVSLPEAVLEELLHAAEVEVQSTVVHRAAHRRIHGCAAMSAVRADVRLGLALVAVEGRVAFGHLDAGIAQAFYVKAAHARALAEQKAASVGAERARVLVVLSRWHLGGTFLRLRSGMMSGGVRGRILA